MNIDKHPILRDLYDITAMVENLGASEELTNISIKLSDAMSDLERYVDSVNKIVPICG